MTRTIDQATGEVTLEVLPGDELATDDPIIDEDSADLYAELHEKANAMRFRQERVLAEVREELEIEHLEEKVRELEEKAQGLAKDDPRWKEAQAELDEARAVTAAMDEQWQQALRDAKPGTVEKAGRVRLRRGKPRETWTLRKPASWYAGRSAKGDLLMLLAERGVEDAVGVANAVIDWLDPTSKAGRDPGVSITVQPPSGGAS